MRRLSDTITRLQRSRAARGAQNRAGHAHLTELTDFGSNPGALKGWAYVPDDLAANAALVVVLHGCTQNAAAYDIGAGWSQLADAQGFAVLLPEQQRSNNGNLCFNWFEPADTRRGSGEALSIRQMVAAMVSAHGLDARRVFVTGLSAGGAMTSVMLATYPEVFAGGAIIAGLPYGSASSVPEAFDRMRGHGGPRAEGLQALLRGASDHAGPWPTLSIWQGSADRTVDASNAGLILDQWRAVHGLTDEPTRSDVVDGYPHELWHDDNGRAVVETYTITGMGHGTPLATGDGGWGESRPFLLDVGISSTAQIARFWGLMPAESARRETRDADRPEPAAIVKAKPIPLRGRVQPSAPAPASAGVGKVIEDALRAAGLMR